MAIRKGAGKRRKRGKVVEDVCVCVWGGGRLGGGGGGG